MSEKNKPNKTIVSAIISIICLQFAFAGIPDWVDTPNAFEYSATIPAAIVSDADGALTGTDLCGYCCEVAGCSPQECCANGVSDSNDILAAFGPDGTCRGIATNLIAAAGPSSGSLIHEIQIRSNDVGDLITFKYYDASADKELIVGGWNYSTATYPYAFVVNDLIGNVLNIVGMDAAPAVTGCMESAASNYNSAANVAGCCEYACVNGSLPSGGPDCAAAFGMGADCSTGLFTYTGAQVTLACPETCGCAPDCPTADCAGVVGGDCSSCDSAGNCLSIFQISSNIPTEFTISQNYPNPFNPVTSISFEVPKTDAISLAVYDLSGKNIITLASGKFMPGTYLVNWDATNYYGQAIASGMYVYRFISSDKAITRKMLYLK